MATYGHTRGPLLVSCISMIEDDNNLDRAVFYVGQILADLDHKMSKSQRDLAILLTLSFLSIFLAGLLVNFTLLCRNLSLSYG